MADPIFSTGIIGLNRIFENAGLDRINLNKISESNKEEILKAYKKYMTNKKNYVELLEHVNKNLHETPSLLRDIRRIVDFYYVFLAMAAYRGVTGLEESNFNPQELTAILVPIKMRGAVFAVSIHATFIPENHYTDNQLWTHNF